MTAAGGRPIAWFLGVTAAIAALTSFPEQARPITCLAGPFYVFFDWNDDAVTAQARPILDNVLSARGNCGQGMRLKIIGYADRSGSERYNMALSRRRAERVRAYMLSRDVAADDMTVEAAGERGPLVETADGAQEAQNRRVEVHYVH